MRENRAHKKRHRKAYRAWGGGNRRGERGGMEVQGHRRIEGRGTG